MTDITAQIDTRELKKGSVYALKLTQNFPRETVTAIREQLNKLNEATGIIFILLGQGMELVDSEEASTVNHRFCHYCNDRPLDFDQDGQFWRCGCCGAERK